MHPALTLPRTLPDTLQATRSEALPDHTAAAIDTIAGLAAGTEVLTLDGAIPVEHLMQGDRLITRGGGIARLRMIHMTEAEVAPVRVEAQSLGRGRPEGAALVGPDTRLLIRDWRAAALWQQPSAMVAASRLVDGQYIRREPPRTMRLFLPCLDTPRVIYAGGLEIGTPPAS